MRIIVFNMALDMTWMLKINLSFGKPSAHFLCNTSISVNMKGNGDARRISLSLALYTLLGDFVSLKNCLES